MSDQSVEKNEKEEKSVALVGRATKAYGIPAKEILAASVDPSGLVTLVTNGGSRVRWREGDKPEPLSMIQITGINPENAKRKPVAGKAK